MRRSLSDPSQVEAECKRAKMDWENEESSGLSELHEAALFIEVFQGNSQCFLGHYLEKQEKKAM